MSIYKACDIRGIYGRELNDEEAYRIGRALGALIGNNSVTIGGDIRISTPRLKEIVTNALLESGCRVTDIGTAPTPVFYYHKRVNNIFGGVMITASHNPSEYNGLKIAMGKWPVEEEDIREIKRLSRSSRQWVQGDGVLSKQDPYRGYKKYMYDRFEKSCKPLKVVIDPGNGVCGPIAYELFNGLGFQVIPMNMQPDGSFPNREPNPAVYTNLRGLCERVRKEGADLGVAYDGDGDRVVFVDENGRAVSSEKSLLIFIEHLFEQRGSGPVVYDLKCSAIVPQGIERLGGTAIREKSGHAFIKRTFLENHCAMGGEISGHFFFEDLQGDDGIYASLLMGSIVEKTGKSLGELADRIPTYCITPDIRIPVGSNRDELLDRVRDKFSGFPADTLDGIRIGFPNGWALARKSVTEPKITLRFEGNTREDLRDIIHSFIGLIPGLEQFTKDYV